MKVRIVTPDYSRKSSAIIARLARHLAKHNGWAVRSWPHPRAVVNVFMPYTHWRFSKWVRTPTAAWFTHKERPETEGGAPLRRWEMASKAVDLQITPAKLYLEDLGEHGRTMQIEHPVELGHFTPKPRKKRKVPRIGVAGRVYAGGRKGEKLVKQLCQGHEEWDFCAAGRGWPIPSSYLAWRDMPHFYCSLDVFLCTSLIEGGPVTVLEALACGKPIVIPRAVGALDELPNMVGIWRYDAGDYGSMVEAIDEALKWPVAVGELRAIVEHRSPQRWARQWAEALEELIWSMA